MALNPESLRKDFPILQKENAPIYFDNACMALRPKQVVDALNGYYLEYPGCAGRSVHAIGQRVDEEVYKARKAVQKFIGAKKSEEVVFLRNTTEAINLVARTFGFQKGDVVITSDKEHNSNLLPWQLLEKKGVQHLICDSHDDNTFSLENFESLLTNNKVKMVALGQTANLDGVSIPAKDVVKLAHKHGAKVLFDAAQSAPHHALDVRSLGADFVAFSGHKMLGPTGIGALYGSLDNLNALGMDNVGGETVTDSTFHSATWDGVPHKFEAGLQHYAGIIGFGAAVNYLDKVGMKNIAVHESKLNKVMTDGLEKMNGFSLIGPQNPLLRGGICSFNVKGVNPHDIAGMLNASKNVMVRSGAHCVHSWFNKHKLDGSVRASTYLYNTEAEAQVFVDEVKEIAKLVK